MRYTPTDVEIRIAADGVITPLRFTWQGAWLAVGQVGRTWTDGEGDHWLVMPPHPNAVFELIRTPEGRWLAARGDSRPAVA